jgi:TolA-binding protein
MKRRILLVCAFLAVPVFAPAASKEIQELQRDIALLQQQIKDLQRSQDEKFASVTELARQAIEAANRADKGVAIIQSNLEKSVRDIQGNVATPVVGLTSRINAVSDNVNTLTQAVSDLTSLLNRMQAQLNDIQKQVAVMNTPVQQPTPQNNGGSGASPGGQAAQSSGPCPTGSTDAYNSALRDYRGGKMDLAVSEFNEYLRCFGNTDFAPNAQFYIASYHFGQHDYETAVREFDMVLEKYPDNNKSAEALLYKGRALANLPGRKTDATHEWQDLIRRYPRAPEAKLACDDLKSFGMNCPTTPSTAAKKGGASKKR